MQADCSGPRSQTCQVLVPGFANGNYKDYMENIYVYVCIGIILGLYGDTGKENRNYRACRA